MELSILSKFKQNPSAALQPAKQSIYGDYNSLYLSIEVPMMSPDGIIYNESERITLRRHLTTKKYIDDFGGNFYGTLTFAKHPGQKIDQVFLAFQRELDE